jgi:hypothetical protein
MLRERWTCDNVKGLYIYIFGSCIKFGSACRGFGIREEQGYLIETLEVIGPHGLEETLRAQHRHGGAGAAEEQHSRERERHSFTPRGEVKPLHPALKWY